jgi:protein TonB
LGHAVAEDTASAWRQVRTILVPQDIVAVPRQSPRRVKTRTPLRVQSEGTSTGRAGDRAWFSDRLFVEAKDGHDAAGYGTAVVVHVGLALGLMAFVVTRPDRLVVPTTSRSLVMPTLVTAVALAELPEPKPIQRREPKAAPDPPAASPAPAPRAIAEARVAAAPIQAPSGVISETGAERQTSASVVDGGVAGGTPTGVTGGVVGGTPGGVTGGLAGGAPPVVVRVGPNMESPRKIKDVKPIYPSGTLQGRTQGAVILEATIGPDGKVRDAKVVRSVPLLDAAALDAVRQWEYTPSFLNGVAVAVIMTVIVNFAMQ